MRHTLGAAETCQPLNELIDGGAGYGRRERHHSGGGIAAAIHIGFRLAPLELGGVGAPKRFGRGPAGIDHPQAHETRVAGANRRHAARHVVVRAAPCRAHAQADIDQRDAVVVRQAVERQPPLMVVGTAEQHIAGAQQVAQVRMADPFLSRHDLDAETRRANLAREDASQI